MLTPNFNLQAFNTLAINARASFFAEANSVEDLRAIIAQAQARKMPLLPLGGGSNIVLAADYQGVAAKVNILGRTVVQEDDSHIWLKLGAGENWHQLVLYCMANNYWGIENLALIPGSVGAAPIQNIGAYGVELKNIFDSLEALEIDTGRETTFDKQACQFGYRESVFKGRYKDQYIIMSVTLKLSKVAAYNIDYPALRDELAGIGSDALTPQNIGEAVCRIRSSKLPAPEDIPNAGSFFKNPVVNHDKCRQLQAAYPNMPNYPVDASQVKLAAGWLIEQAGWKGKDLNGAAVHSKQALVLTNPNKLSGEYVLNLAAAVQAAVQSKFGIALEIEPRVYS